MLAGKGNFVFLTPAQGQALRVLGKIFYVVIQIQADYLTGFNYVVYLYLFLLPLQSGS